MTFFLIIIIVLALCVCFYFAAARLRTDPAVREPSSGLPVAALCIWLAATVVWGRPFFEIALPGIFDITVDRLLLGCLIVLLIAGMYSGRGGLTRLSALELTLLAFVLLCLVSMTIHGFRPVLPGFPSPWNTFINGYLFPVIAFVYARSFIRRPGDLYLVFTTVFLLGAYLCVTAFFEFFGLRAFVVPRYITDPDVLIHIDRARGPFLNAAFNGAAITFGFICGLHLLPEKKGLSRALHLALLSITPPAVFFTQTRSAYLGFVIALILFLAFYRTRIPKWKVCALPVALCIAFLLANAPRLVSEDRRSGGLAQLSEIEIRMELFSRSLSIAAMSPLFGVGMGQFIPVSAASFPAEAASLEVQEELQHFHVLGLLAELGIAGALLYLLLVVFVFKRLHHLRRHLPETGFISGNLVLAIAALWIVYLTTNLFLEPSYCLFLNAVPFVCAGAADGMYSRRV